MNWLLGFTGLFIVWVAFFLAWGQLVRRPTRAERLADDAAQMRALEEWQRRHDRT